METSLRTELSQPINSINENTPSASLNTELTKKLPQWALNSVQIKDHYYKCHEVTWLDRLIGWIASRVGIIVHGNLSQDQLEAQLQKFDLERLLEHGPYLNPILSTKAQELIAESLRPLDRVCDVHLHNLGYDEDNYLDPMISARSQASWLGYLTFLFVRFASGMTAPIGSTQEARRRIHLYAKHFPKLHGFILPIHKAYTETREVDWKKTGNFLTNKSAFNSAKSFNDSHSNQLHAAVSIHPLDPKWFNKVHKAYRKGIRLIKWMPPQSIQPDSKEMINFYDTLARLKMTLIAHSGPEHALPVSPEWQDWGNPLRFREALQLGVNVILAHCGHKDLIEDLDDPEKKKVPGYELFARLAREAHQNKWKGKLYGDLAAVPTHYGPNFIKNLLIYSQEPGFRFIYGSDYPYTNLIEPRKDAYQLMAKEGLLDPQVVRPLSEIRNYNPLLANFVFTRLLKLKTDSAELTFPLATFSGDFEEDSLSKMLY